MATIDSSIYGRVGAGADLGGLARGFQLGQGIRQGQVQNKLAELAFSQKQAEVEQRNRLMPILSAPGSINEHGQLNPAILPQIAQEAPTQVPEYAQLIQAQQKAMNDAQISKLNQTKAKIELVGRLVGGIVDEPSHQFALQQAQALGVPLDGVPGQYDPAWVAQMKQQTLTYQQQLDSFMKQQGLDLQRERLELERTAPRGQVVDTAGGVMIVDPRSGTARPAVGADNEPVMGERASQAQKQQRERRVEAIEAQQAVENSAANLDRLISEAQGIMADPSLKRITGLAGSFPNLPGGDAANVQARLETLKSQAGFAVLQAMRDASKTGGALGNVSNFEVQALQNNLAALDTKQGPEAFQRSLQQVIDYAQGVKQRMGEAYQRQYGDAQGGAQQDQGAAKPADRMSELDQILGF